MEESILLEIKYQKWGVVLTHLESGIIPALRDIKHFEKMLKSKHETVIFLETRVSQLADLVAYAKKHAKTVYVHADLVQGLKSDDYGIEFLIRNVKADGIISTRTSAISFAKKNNVTGILRLFALDSHALDHNITSRVKPDYIEVLPGVVPQVITEVHEATGVPIIAGGLIRTEQDVIQALETGAKAVTTSNPELWRF
ncbi:glycerol-3-phosphate responsive antiterminator [Oceanobacillus luteolus]|uniref:glycerol-3-phosphate responsive antiterminator n=1 Tax=Oceanobacillus luteolus TaxID=1274358 RepID=UPI00203F7507|nr:glycerol-3-phosphate responsive antiterminator [Oceanobacillus luteolus]MCM3742457.1 glycerol-3-phosphate responsive antiterminator [Oceanobacillus luteolus]